MTLALTAFGVQMPKVSKSLDLIQSDVEGRLGSLAEALAILDLMEAQERGTRVDVQFVREKIRAAQRRLAELLPAKYRREM